MKTRTGRNTRIFGGAQRARAFTLIECLVAILVGGTMLAALYGSFACGFAVVRNSRENLRATQILLGRIEAIRLCSWTQVTNPTNNPPSFTDYYDAQHAASGHGGVVYNGTMTTSVPAAGTLPDAYRTNMLLVTVGVTWNSGNVQHSRSMKTYVAREGMQSFVSVGH